MVELAVPLTPITLTEPLASVTSTCEPLMADPSGWFFVHETVTDEPVGATAWTDTDGARGCATVTMLSEVDVHAEYSDPLYALALYQLSPAEDAIDALAVFDDFLSVQLPPAPTRCSNS